MKIVSHSPQASHPLKFEITPTKKDWLKFIGKIDDPYLCEALIIELEARKNKLNPDFNSHSPRGDAM